MVKFYKMMMAVVLGLVSLTTSAINVTVNVDDPARVKISVAYVEQEVVAGDNTFDVAEYACIEVKAAEGNLLKSVTRKSNNESITLSQMASAQIYVYEFMEGETYTVTSAPESEVRTGTYQVYVDESSKVRLMRSGSYSEVRLENGWNDVHFVPEVETQLMVAPADYSVQLYQVKLDDAVIQPLYGQYQLDVKEGSRVEIQANFPDVDVPVHFVLADEETEDFITGVQVNGESVYDYTTDNFTVKAGASMTISMNTTDYAIDEFTVNGQPASFYGSTYTTTILDETTFSLKAHKYGIITATIDIDDPSNIVCYKGAYYNNDVMELKAGENPVQMNELECAITIKAQPGCYVTSVTDSEGITYSKDYNDMFNVTLKNGMKLTVVTGKIVRDQHAVVYIDDRSAAATYFNMERQDRSKVEVETGYNTIDFYAVDVPLSLSWAGAMYENVYVNDEKISPKYEGSTTFSLDIKDGDVIKLFLASNPKFLSVDFDVDEKVDAQSISVKKDLIVPVENWTEGFKVLPKTKVELTVADADAVTVDVNGKAIEAADGVFAFEVKMGTTVTITSNTGTGITNVVKGAAAKGVYTIQGTKVLNAGEVENLNKLPQGVYIVNGKKVVVR